MKTSFYWYLRGKNGKLHEAEVALKTRDVKRASECCIKLKKDMHPCSDLYCAVSLMYAKYSTEQAKELINRFEEHVMRSNDVVEIPPVYYFLQYYMWHEGASPRGSKIDSLPLTRYQYVDFIQV